MRPFVNDRLPDHATSVTSATPALLFTSSTAFDVLFNVPWMSTDCDAMPASEYTGVPDDGFTPRVAPGFTWISPRINAPPVRFRLNTPCVTVKLSHVTGEAPVAEMVAPLLYSKSPYVRPFMDGVMGPSTR